MLEKILAAAQKIRDELPGELGFAFYDLKTGKSCYLQEKVPFPTASVIKIYLLTELFRQAEAGLVDLTKRVEITPEEAAPGSGVLNKLHYPVSLTLYDHAVLMMQQSDNTSTDVVLETIGRESVRRLFADLDLQESAFGEQLYIREGDRQRKGYYNTVPTDTSPRNLAKMLRALYHGEVMSLERSREALELMQPQPKVARLEKYLPKGTVVRRKTGSEPSVTNDAGIVFTDKGDYIIAVFYNARNAPQDAIEDPRRLRIEDAMARLSRAVFDIYTA